jgi:uncharacterized protein
MIVRVSEIPEEGLRFEGVHEFASPFQDPQWELLALSLLVEKDQEDVLVSGHLSAGIPQTCSRCLETFPFAVEAEVNARFVPRPQGRSEEVELTPDDLEVDFYDDDLLNLDRLIETETALALPMKPLCRADCRGLCPLCGGNRNVNPCACEVKTPDPRLAVLQQIADRLQPK